MCTAMRVHCKVVNMHTIAHCLHQIVQNLNCCLDIKLYLFMLSYANAHRSDVILAFNFVKFKYYGYGIL